MNNLTRYQAQIVYAYGRSSDMFVYHENDMSSRGRTIRLDPTERGPFKDRQWIEYSLKKEWDEGGEYAINIEAIEDPRPRPPMPVIVKPRLSGAIDKPALLAELAEHGVVNIKPCTAAFGIGFEMVKAGELIITKHGSNYYELSPANPVTLLSDDQQRVLSECFAKGLVEVIGEQMDEGEGEGYAIYGQLQKMGLIYYELNTASMGVLFAKYEITETGKALCMPPFTPLPMENTNTHIEHDSEGRPVLIVNIPHTKECAHCGMDDSMESNLQLCPVCHCCLHWEVCGVQGSCCTCSDPTRSIDEIYARAEMDDF